jgi:hypothetical protein
MEILANPNPIPCAITELIVQGQTSSTIGEYRNKVFDFKPRYENTLCALPDHLLSEELKNCA